jgi:hypothetical protein
MKFHDACIGVLPPKDDFVDYICCFCVEHHKWILKYQRELVITVGQVNSKSTKGVEFLARPPSPDRLQRNDVESSRQTNRAGKRKADSVQLLHNKRQDSRASKDVSTQDHTNAAASNGAEGTCHLPQSEAGKLFRWNCRKETPLFRDGFFLTFFNQTIKTRCNLPPIECAMPFRCVAWTRSSAGAQL